jgi:hypothetical protein
MILGNADQEPGDLTSVMLILQVLSGWQTDVEFENYFMLHKQNVGIDDAIHMLQKEADVR